MLARMREHGLGATVACTIMVLAYLFPVYWMVATSLKPQKDVFAVPPRIVPWPPTFASYEKAVIGNDLVAQSLLNSAIIGVGTTLLTLVLAVPAAYGLARLKLRFTVAFALFRQRIDDPASHVIRKDDVIVIAFDDGRQGIPLRPDTTLLKQANRGGPMACSLGRDGKPKATSCLIKKQPAATQQSTVPQGTTIPQP